MVAVVQNEIVIGALHNLEPRFNNGRRGATQQEPKDHRENIFPRIIFIHCVDSIDSLSFEINNVSARFSIRPDEHGATRPLLCRLQLARAMRTNPHHACKISLDRFHIHFHVLGGMEDLSNADLFFDSIDDC